MKVQINLKVASKEEATAAVDLIVSAEDTVQSAKERIAAAQLVAFPEQDLVLDGEVLEESLRLSECGVKEGSSLDFVVRASEASLAKQLAELLRARDLSSDELGLLYCYKHGVSVKEALKSLGHDGKLQDFLKKQKGFLVENGLVTVLREDTAPKPAVPQGPPGLASLKSSVPEGPPGLSGVRRQATPPRNYQRPEPQAQTAPAAPAAPVDGQQYLELHTKISGRSFNSKIAQILNDIVEVVCQRLFLNVDHVVKGGSVGKGTAIMGCSDAEVVLFLAGMPAASMTKWLPPLLKAAATVLTEHLAEGQHGAGDVSITGDSVRLTAKGLVTLDLRFAPVFASHAEAIEAMRSKNPDARRFLAASLAKEKAQFIAKQPGQVKVTMRLLKWWRDQQQWSSACTRPSDDILELVAVYSAVQTKPADQHAAIANVMSLLARFEELRIVWSNFYGKEDIWPALLHQRPLLMDPTNPFLNVADPQLFDARELMELAQTTHFFW